MSKAKQSAGILLYRRGDAGLEFFLVHPGGPFWKNKDAGAWSIPKGEFETEDALTAASREFKEETGFDCDGEFIELQPLKQRSGKMIYAFALEQDLDASAVRSNEFEIEWPPRSGKKKSFPEVDKAGWFSYAAAKEKILPGQWAFIEELLELLGVT